jgi:ubiquinol-cytochrome c reductase cytochrome b subunit
MKFAHWLFIVNFFILMWIGSQHPETPFVEIGQFATLFYFSWFLIIVPIIGIIENTLFDLALISNKEENPEVLSHKNSSHNTLKSKPETLVNSPAGVATLPFENFSYEGQSTEVTSKKTLIRRIIIGWLRPKKGLSVPTLPDHIIKLQKNVFIRMLRVLGGISTLLIITKSLAKIANGNIHIYILLLIICGVFNLIFLFYLCYINYHRISHIYKILKSDKLDIRNSPLDTMARICARMLLCAKGVCEGVGPLGVVFGGMTIVDEVRKVKGLEPLFIPLIADIFIKDTEATKIYKEQEILAKEALAKNTEMNDLMRESKIINDLKKAQFISEDEALEWQQGIDSKVSLIKVENKEIKSKILETVDKLNEIRGKRN